MNNQLYAAPQIFQLFDLCAAACEERRGAEYYIDVECETCHENRVKSFASEALAWLSVHVGHRTHLSRVLSDQEGNRKTIAHGTGKPLYEQLDDEILNALRNSAQPLSPEQIRQATRQEVRPEAVLTVKKHLQRLEEAKKVRLYRTGKSGRGNHALWIINEGTTQAA